MTPIPAAPKIYHITHVDNLASIIADGALYSDAVMIQRSDVHATIGMSEIKTRRLRLAVDCHHGTRVGDYVPFYFCPRSVMLYVIHCANHPELSYRGGQEPIVHLEMNLHAVVDWADAEDGRWAFSLSNAGAVYAEFRASLPELDQINWTVVAARDWRDPDIKENKQAEFLVHEAVPWYLVSRIGVRNLEIKNRAEAIIADAAHQPIVLIKSDWYY